MLLRLLPPPRRSLGPPGFLLEPEDAADLRQVHAFAYDFAAHGLGGFAHRVQAVFHPVVAWARRGQHALEGDELFAQILYPGFIGRGFRHFGLQLTYQALHAIQIEMPWGRIHGGSIHVG